MDSPDKETISESRKSGRRPSYVNFSTGELRSNTSNLYIIKQRKVAVSIHKTSQNQELEHYCLTEQNFYDDCFLAILSSNSK